MPDSKKIRTIEGLARTVASLKKKGKKVVMSHGIFDLIHPGIIEHLNAARSKGDVLVVGVVRDDDAKIGPGRPLFPEDFRLKSVASMEQVDYACIVENNPPYASVMKIKPDMLAKGRGDKDQELLLRGMEQVEEQAKVLGNVKVFETDGFSFSSSQIANTLLDIYPEPTREFLKAFREKYSFEFIAETIHSFKDMNVLLVGDGIIDEYHFCEAMHRSAKTPLVVNRHLYMEEYTGGAFAIANHLAGIVGNVKMVTLLGAENSRADFVSENIKPNVEPKFFYRDDGPTIVKKRYINEALNWKLFEVNYLNNQYINDGLVNDVISYLREIIEDYDLVLVSDFGHGFISRKIMRALEKHSKVLAINTQTNAANVGFNLITKYKKPNFVCLDEPEMRLATQERFKNVEDITKRVMEHVDADLFIVTMGRKGSIGVARGGEIAKTPIFSTKVVDTIGAGDAFFSFTAPCFARGLPVDFISFIGNAVGALAVQIIGNKESVEKYDLLKFINTILK